MQIMKYVIGQHPIHKFIYFFNKASRLKFIQSINLLPLSEKIWYIDKSYSTIPVDFGSKFFQTKMIGLSVTWGLAATQSWGLAATQKCGK